MTEKRGIKAEDLYELRSVANPIFSSKGDKVVYVVTGICKEKNDYYSNLFVLDMQTKQSYQWTYGKYRNHSPQWSNDGEKLAFVSNRSGENQIYLMNCNGGEAKQLTSVNNGATNPNFSPDGKKLAFSVSLKKDEEIINTKEKDQKKEKKELEPIEVEKMKYKSDAGGLFNGKYRHIAIMDLETEEIKVVTKGEHHFGLLNWSPDGKWLAITANISEDEDFTFNQDIYLYNIETEQLINITNGRGIFHQCSWSHDGQHVALVGHEREYENATLNKIWIYDLQNEKLNCLSKDWDIAVGDYVVGDFQQGVVTPAPIWTNTNDGLYFIVSNEGSTNIYFTDLEGQIKQVTNERGHIFGLTMAKDERAVAAISYPTKPSDLYEIDLANGDVSRLTAINDSFLENILLSQPEPIEFPGAKDWTVHGWIMKPVDYRAGEKYPMILEVHGGPHAMYANTYFHEFQLLAAQGYVVLYTNPRGSHGYGQQFVNAVRGDYGGNDYQDLMAAVDYALNTFDFIDENRLGVTGGSYGGFMTNWIVGHTNRFKAAVTQRSISNWISFYGVSDIGYYFNEWQHQLDLTDVEGLWKISPLAYVDNIETPLLILHSEKDYRCPIEQAEQLFIALKHRKKVTKFIRFPEENHELSRSGKPHLRIHRLNYIVAWFNQYLQ